MSCTNEWRRYKNQMAIVRNEDRSREERDAAQEEADTILDEIDECVNHSRSLSACEREHVTYLIAERNYRRGSGSAEACRQALGEFSACIRFNESIAEGRASHSAAMDERRYLQMKELMEAQEKLFGKLKPRPPKDITRTLEVRNQIFSTPGNAIVFGTHLAHAFKEAGIDVRPNEMFECYVCIREKPANIMELLPSTRLKDRSPMNFITEPKLMKQLMDAVAKGND